MSLLSKYNIAAPRYTSYPTVPAWDCSPSEEQWAQRVSARFQASNAKNGISLYIHLPFCESLCTYCACNTRITVNHAVEQPYIEALLTEWSLYLSLFDARPRIREIHLGGGTPTFFSPANLQRLITGLLEGAEVGDTADFGFEGHPANTSKEHLELLYTLGFRRVSFGIQDFDPSVQEVINRYQSYAQVAKVVQEARRIGYTSVNFDLVYGLPLQTSDGIRNTIEQVIGLQPDRIAFYSYAHVPWVKPGQRKFTEKDLPVDEEKRRLYEIGLSLLGQAGYRNVGLDHFAFESDTLYQSLKAGQLHRNFMGYTDSYTELMIGLGASAISDTWDAFAQNHKTVEGYQQAVSEGHFPIFKGHLLTSEDLTMRRHILNIMCRNGTRFTAEELQLPAVRDGLQRCEALEEDGLITIAEGHLVVAAAGQPFLRNVSLCFDARHWRNVPQTATYSTVA